MKWLVSILLLLVTACYVLPVKEFMHGGHAVCMADMDDCKEESPKKEKNKDFIGVTAALIVAQLPLLYAEAKLPVSTPSLLHTVETPPPDRA